MTTRIALQLGTLVTFAAGCSPEACPKGSERRANGLCYLLDSAPNAAEDTATGSTDTADTADPDDDSGTPSTDYTYGDPISLLGLEASGGGEAMPIVYEWTDAAAINDDLAIVTGQGGYGIIDMATGTLLHQEFTRRALRVATDGQTAILASRNDGLMLVDVSPGADTRGQSDFFTPPLEGVHEDVDVDGNRVLIGWHANGGVLVDLSGNLLGTLPATDAFAVSLSGNQALLTDQNALVLFDISDPAAPVELDRQPLSGEGRDLSWEGEHAVVGMGGAGVSVWTVAGDSLVHRSDLTLPGSALSVAVDGDRAWIGAWAVTGLVDLAADPPVMLGHEPPAYSSMGVGASGGRAVVADWFASTALQANDGMAGPEIVVDDALYFDWEDSNTQLLSVTNHGVMDLELSTDPAADGYMITPTALTVAPGTSATLRVDWQGGESPSRATMEWTSNDPDETTGTVSLGPTDQGMGTEHDDFSSPGFQLPESAERIYTLSDERGKAVVLVYWALF